MERGKREVSPLLMLWLPFLRQSLKFWMSCNCAAKEPLHKENKAVYNKWKATHEPDCSAPRMESDGATGIFGQSVEKYGVLYLQYYCDGDSKSFEKVKNIYPGQKVIKYECIGHYQKRVGNRLRKLRA